MSTENVRPESEQHVAASHALSHPPQHLKQFNVHVPRQVQVRFHWKNMCAAVSGRFFNEVLGELLTTDGAVAYNVIQLKELSGALDQRYARYVFGEELLRSDKGDGARPQRLEQLVGSEFEARGLQPARARLAALLPHFMSVERQKKATRIIAEKIFADLQRRAPNSIATLQLLLEQSIEQLVKMSEQVSKAVNAIDAQRTQLQEALREARQRTAEQFIHAGDAHVGAEEDDKNIGGVRRAWRAVSKMVVKSIGGSGAEAASDAQSGEAANEAPAGVPTLADQIERELLHLELRMAVRQAEQEMLKSLTHLLSHERDNNQVLLNLMHAGQQSAPSAVAQAERTRDYSLAGGEFLLNDAELTDAALEVGFATSATTRKHWLDSFRTSCLEAINQAGGRHEAALLERMYKRIEEAVCRRFEGFTVVDALVALQRHNQHFEARLRTAFEEVARPDFLAPGYERYLDLQRFASVTYVPGGQEDTDAAFRTMLDNTLQAIHVAARIAPGGIDAETLRFCVVDYVPITTLSCYQESLGAYDKHKDDPRYNIHPELPS
jgi:hypothetical protein